MLRPFLAALALLLALAACESNQARGSAPEPRPRPTRSGSGTSTRSTRCGPRTGSPPVQLSAELNAAAETHARDMAVQQRAWHFGSDLTSPRERAFRAGYQGEVVGENLSEGSDSDLTVLASWLDFADTRAVILDPRARGLGIGWYQEPHRQDLVGRAPGRPRPRALRRGW